MKLLTRDDTEHGKDYYTAAHMAQKDAEIERLKHELGEEMCTRDKLLNTEGALERAQSVIDALKAKVWVLEGLLDEVSACFTREDDLPDELIPRIDAALEKEVGQ